MKGSLKDSKEFLRLSKPAAAANKSAPAPFRSNPKGNAASNSAPAQASTPASNAVAASALLSSKLCPSLCRPADSELSIKWQVAPPVLILLLFFGANNSMAQVSTAARLARSLPSRQEPAA